MSSLRNLGHAVPPPPPGSATQKKLLGIRVYDCWIVGQVMDHILVLLAWSLEVPSSCVCGTFTWS